MTVMRTNPNGDLIKIYKWLLEATIRYPATRLNINAESSRLYLYTRRGRAGTIVIVRPGDWRLSGQFRDSFKQ